MIELETRPAPTETVTPLRLSEELRLGSLDTMQIDGQSSNGGGGFCALGTIWYVRGWYDRSGNLTDTYMRPRKRIMPENDPATKANCPVTPCMELNQSDTVAEWIIHFNDEHKWSREAIADWLEGLGL